MFVILILNHWGQDRLFSENKKYMVLISGQLISSLGRGEKKIEPTPY